jgi:hypothetical protein
VDQFHAAEVDQFQAAKSSMGTKDEVLARLDGLIAHGHAIVGTYKLSETGTGYYTDLPEHEVREYLA